MYCKLHQIIFGLFLALLISSESKLYAQEVEQLLDWAKELVSTDYPIVLDSIEKTSSLEHLTPVEHCLLLDKKAEIYSVYIGNHELAMEAVKKIDSIYQVTGRHNQKLKIIYLESLGMLYYESGTNPQRALDCFKEAFHLSNELGGSFRTNSILNNYGVNLLNQNKIAKAKEMFRQSIDLSYTQKDYSLLMSAKTNLAFSYIYLNQLDSAENTLIELSKLTKKTTSMKDDFSNYSYLGRFYLDHKLPLKSKTYLDSAEAIIHTFTSYREKSFLYETYASLFNSQGNFKNAFEAMNIKTAYDDSATNLEINTSLWGFDYQTKLIEAKYEIQVAQKKAEIANRKTRFRFLLIISVLAFSILIVVIIYIRLLGRKRIAVLNEQKMNAQLELNNREVATKSLILLEKNNLLTNVIDKLTVLQDKVSAMDKNKVREILSEIKSSQNTVDWEEFNFRFAKVHPEFYERLQSKFPNLTANDRKISAFMVMGMSSKEVSSITGKSVHSINIARIRLRKKLGLVNKPESLEDFLLKYTT